MVKNFQNHYPSLLVGISGTFAGGKDTAAKHLVREKAFMHVSTGDVLRTEATRQGRDHERETLIDISVELRRLYGSIGSLVFRAVAQWEENRGHFPGGLVISGIRVVGEAVALQEIGGKLLFIDAPVETRYGWALQRAFIEGRTANIAHITCLGEFAESEKRELYGVGDPERPHLRGIEQIADKVIQNTGTKEDLYRQVEAAVAA